MRRLWFIFVLVGAVIEELICFALHRHSICVVSFTNLKLFIYNKSTNRANSISKRLIRTELGPTGDQTATPQISIGVYSFLLSFIFPVVRVMKARSAQ